MSTTSELHDESMEERLGHVGARIDDLTGRLCQASGKLRASVGEHLASARTRRQELRADLERLREAKAKAWEDYAAKVEAAEAEMHADVAIARAQLDADLAKTRDDFVAAVRAELEAWRTRIDQLKGRAESARAETRDQLNATLQQLREQREAAVHKAEEVAEASVDAWTSLREGMRRALDEIGSIAERASAEAA
jgi:hypothetical protein